METSYRPVVSSVSMPSGGTRKTVRPRWRDPKKLLWMLGILAPMSALLPSQLVLHTGSSIFWWSGILVFFVVIPALDHIVGEDGANPPDDEVEDLHSIRYYRWCTFAFLPVQLVGLLVACYLWAHGSLSVVDKIGYAITVGLVAGTGINAAHELGHRLEAGERRLAKFALAQSMYGHFFVEHNRGHHVRVATPTDPASARLGESLYRFLPRSVLGGLRSAWSIEAARLARRGQPVWSPRNNLLNAWALTVLLFGALVAVFGVGILPYLVLQGVVGFLMLESVNYIEHYGLLRAVDHRGRYERCRPRHSWNSDRVITNVFLFHLQRHSDHHANPTRRFQALRSFDESPQLPAGYASMVLLATIPWLWRRVMDPRVLRHYDGDIERANLAPSRRAKVVAERTSPSIAA